MAPMEAVARELGLILRTVKGLHHATVTAAGVRLELPALSVLTMLSGEPPMRISTLAELLHLDLSSVSRQVSAIEREGWVSRQRDPGDSRATLLQLTPDGADVLRRVRAQRVHQLTRLLPGWSVEELDTFAAQLHRFRTDLSTGTGATSPLHGTPIHGTPLHGTPVHGTTDRTPALAGQENR